MHIVHLFSTSSPLFPTHSHTNIESVEFVEFYHFYAAFESSLCKTLTEAEAALLPEFELDVSINPAHVSKSIFEFKLSLIRLNQKFSRHSFNRIVYKYHHCSFIELKWSINFHVLCHPMQFRQNDVLTAAQLLRLRRRVMIKCNGVVLSAMRINTACKARPLVV